MDILIESATQDENGTYFTASCGNKSACVCFSVLLNNLMVCCQNASHRVWRGMGRMFDTVEEAVEGYRSPEMKAIILAAEAFKNESGAFASIVSDINDTVAA